MVGNSNFRLSDSSRAILSGLASHFGVTKTEVVEEALRHYAKEKRLDVRPKINHPIAKYIGMWKDVDVDWMLNEIYTSRRPSRRKPPTW